MKGWILYNDLVEELRNEQYAITRFVDSAKEQGVEIEVVAPERFDLLITDHGKAVLLDDKEVVLPDFLIPRMGSNTNYFALAVIRHLERLGIYSVNSSESIDIVKDKLFTHQILAQNNLPVPKTMLAKFNVGADFVEEYFGFPVVIKTVIGTQGNGVFLSESKGKFRDFMQFIESTSPQANIILQEYIADSHGRDLRVFTIGGHAVACMERKSISGFKANFSQGGEVSAYPITPEIEVIANETAKVLNLDIAGIDLLFSGDHYKICEANSSPDFRGLESCCDIDIPKEIYKFVRGKLGVF